MDVVTKRVEAQLIPVDDDDGNPNGDFRAILSTEDLDRDDEELDADDWLLPLPGRINIDTDHGMSVEKTVGSATPTLKGRQLHVDGGFSSVPHAQLTRTLVKEGHIDKMSVTYRVVKDANGNRKRELLSGAFVAVPANPNAVVLSAKSAKTDDDDGSKPYGDVKYADPGYQDDGKARYPVDTADHCRSAWSYINQPANAGKYSPAELSKVKGRIRSAAAKFDIEIADDSKKSVGTVYVDVVPRVKQLDASGNNPPEKSHAQTIHDVAVALGAQCAIDADTGEDEGANSKSLTQTSNTKDVGTSQESADKSAATATAEQSAVAAAADAPADDVATQAHLAARGRSLAFLMSKNIERD